MMTEENQGALLSRTRCLGALMLLVPLSLWAGPMILNLGFGGLWGTLALTIVAAAVICRIAPCNRLLFGVLTGNCIFVSVFLEWSQDTVGRSDLGYWKNLVESDWQLWFLLWVLLMFLSLIVATAMDSRW